MRRLGPCGSRLLQRVEGPCHGFLVAVDACCPRLGPKLQWVAAARPRVHHASPKRTVCSTCVRRRRLLGLPIAATWHHALLLTTFLSSLQGLQTALLHGTVTGHGAAARTGNHMRRCFVEAASRAHQQTDS